ncbi:hypothetical protein FACS189459_1410 [Bacilli bacterium]|nr:hypothetical protein FACS189459_1410 [Bacilli bacterium]
MNKIFKSIAYNFTNIKIVDVGNTSNILSDKLSSNKIEKIMQSAKKVVDSQN